MSSVTIYGASDDLIELDGDLSEEFPLRGARGDLVAFGDGTVLRVRFGDDEMWRIETVHAGYAVARKTEATDPDVDYSDRVTLTGDLRWCCHGNTLHRIGPTQ